MLKSKTKKIMAAAAGMLLLCSVAAAETAGLQTVTKAGSNATVQANPKNYRHSLGHQSVQCPQPFENLRCSSKLYPRSKN